MRNSVPDRLRRFVGDHLDGAAERKTGPQRAHHQVDRLRELFVEQVNAPALAGDHHDEGQQSRARGDAQHQRRMAQQQVGQHAAEGGQRQREQREDADLEL